MTTQRKQLMDTKLTDGVGYVEHRDQPVCERCLAAFEHGQSWYYPADLDGPHCSQCLIALQEETYQWYAAMDDWNAAQQDGQIDPETLEPMGPMYAMPF